MPTQQDMDKAAADFLHYTQRVSELTQTAAELQKGVDVLTKTKEDLAATVQETKDALPGVRQTLLDLEKEVEKVRQQKVDEENAERATHEAMQKQIAEDTSRLSGLTDELQKRSLAMDDREKVLKDGMTALSVGQKKVMDDQTAVAGRENLVEQRENDVVSRGKALETRSIEIEKRITEAVTRETSAAAAETRTREDRIAMDEKAGKAAADLNEAKDHLAMLVQTKAEINRLLPVLKDFYDYVKTHGHDPDGIAMTFKQLFPLADNARNQGQLV